MPRLAIIGKFTSWTLDSSYSSAFAQAGYEILQIDVHGLTQQNARLGRVGQKLTNYLDVDAWTRKANREMAVQILAARPEVVVVMGNWRVQAGALAQIKAATGASLVNIWPDTLLNLQDYQILAFPLYDLVATYSQASLEPLRQLGAKNAVWTPLAGDPELHPAVDPTPAEREALASDITFIGGWRPEREAVLTRLAEAKEFKLKIWGPEWGARCKGNQALLASWQGRDLRGADFAKAIRSAKLNLNIIDPTNYPAANMRFFEVPIAGGLQISSPCPEMETEFRGGREIYYYQSEDDLLAQTRELLANETQRARVVRRAHELAREKHTYLARARAILANLKS
jgi:spore maturation protein CgeB